MKRSLFGGAIEKDAVVILGMHRSSTSLLAQYLRAGGLDLGDNFIPVADDNKSGFWEDEFFVQVNRDMLTKLGVQQDGFAHRDILLTIPERSKSLVGRTNTAHVAEYVTTEFSGPVFAWKDPRTCLTYPYWRQALRDVGIKSIKLIVVYRSPVEVARSLIARESDEYFRREKELALQRAFDTWRTYNDLCLQYGREDETLFLDNRDILGKKITNALVETCLKFSNVKISNDFVSSNIFDPKLVHQMDETSPIPDDVKATYAQLKKKRFRLD